MTRSADSERGLFRLAGALLGCHLVLWGLSAVGIAWFRPLTVLLWLAIGIAAFGALRSALSGLTGPLRMDLRHRPGRLASAALALGLGAFGALALASWLGWNVHPDWVFHWGPKAHRFALAGGIDVHYLTRPWNGHVHPDYPTLLPNLTASLALALDTPVTPRLGAVVTLVFSALWLAGLRALALRLAGPGLFAEAAWVTSTWSVTMFATGFQQAAGADLPFACAVTLGALALTSRRRHRSHGLMAEDTAVAVAAALASQTKFEGAPFAVLLVSLWLVRRFAAARAGLRPRALLHATVGAALLPASVLVAWWGWNAHHGLFQPSNAGALTLDRLPAVARGLWDAASERAWHGLPFLLLCWPWLLLRRGVCWPALLLAGQLAVYAGVYLTTPVDLDLLLLTSAPRLLFHLVPTFLVLLVVAIGRPARRLPEPRLQPSPDASTDAGSAASSDEPVSPSFLA